MRLTCIITDAVTDGRYVFSRSYCCTQYDRQ